MSVLGINAKDCQRRAADNTEETFARIAEKVNEAVNKGLGSVTVEVFLPSAYEGISDEEIPSLRRNVIGAIENDGFQVTINEAKNRYMVITIAWHNVSDENEKAIFETEREIETRKFEEAYNEARSKVVSELFDLKLKSLELNPDYLNTVEEVKRLEDERNEIMLIGAFGMISNWRHACDLRRRYAKVRDEFRDALRKYNGYRKSLSQIKVHPAVDIIHERQVLQNLLLYGFNRK